MPKGKNILPEFNLKQVIHYLYQDTILPEVYEVLGEENTLQLILIFGGLKVSIPTYKEMKDLSRNIDIFKTLSYSNSTETANMLSKKYGITNTWVRGIYREMRKEYPKILEHMQAVDEPQSVRVTTKRNQKHYAKENSKNNI